MTAQCTMLVCSKLVCTYSWYICIGIMVYALGVVYNMMLEPWASWASQKKSLPVPGQNGILNVQKFDRLDHCWTLEMLCSQNRNRNRKNEIEISSIPASTLWRSWCNARNAMLVPVSYCEPGLSIQISKRGIVYWVVFNVHNPLSILLIQFLYCHLFLYEISLWSARDFLKSEFSR